METRPTFYKTATQSSFRIISSGRKFLKKIQVQKFDLKGQKLRKHRFEKMAFKKKEEKIRKLVLRKDVATLQVQGNLGCKTFLVSF